MKCEACGHINETRKKSKLQDSDFERFWKLYPRKIGKFLAQKVWSRIQGDAALTEIIIQAVLRQRRSTDWMKDNGAYIPHASTWLNQRRWTDDVPEDGKIVHLSASQDPLNQAKMDEAKRKAEDLMEKLRQRDDARREAAKRDALRSQKMLEAAGEKEDNFTGAVGITPQQIGNLIGPVFSNLKDENGNKWIEEMERSGADGE